MSVPVTDAPPTAPAPQRWGAVMGLYLLGIFMGAIDTGIVTPGRTVIANDLRVDDATGIWMITIYTLAYAAAIPVMGKLADRLGRKKVYLLSIALFGIGSLFCGLAQDVASFPLLIAARAVQAIGGGGIVPIATAEIGTEVPPEKRGMALGLVGMVYGVANIFGASAGSLILDLVGTHNWQWIFYVNLPIAVVIILAGLKLLPSHVAGEVKPIDVPGIVVLVAMILALLYGLRNIDYFAFTDSVASPEVWPFLVGFAVLLPVFLLVERRAQDPVLNVGYFTDRGIALTLLLSFLTGFILMGVVFVPQLAENALKIASGSGGYFVIALGLASGTGAPLSGRLTDQFGPTRVLALGAVLSIVAALVVVFWLIPAPSLASVLVGLSLVGLGLGFLIGSPLNYMMLQRTPKAESASALGTLSLMRSIGTTVAPAVLIGFLVHAGGGVQDRLTAELPTTIAAPALPHAGVLTERIKAWQADPELADKLGSLDVSRFNATTIEVSSMTGTGTLPADLVELLSTADVTTITQRTKVVAERMFADQTPARVAEIQAGVDAGVAGLDAALASLDQAAADMTAGLAEMDANLPTMTQGLADMDASLAEMRAGLATMASGLAGIDAGIAGMRKGIAGLQQAIAGMDAGLADQRAVLARLEGVPVTSPQVLGQIEGLKAGIAQLQAKRAAAASELATLQKKLTATQAERAKLAAARAKLDTGRRELTEARAKLATGREELTRARADLAAARDTLAAKRAELVDTKMKMTELRAGVPAAFQASLAAYLAEIDARGPRLEAVFQSGLNEGFRDIYVLYGAASLLTLLLLGLVPKVPRDDSDRAGERA